MERHLRSYNTWANPFQLSGDWLPWILLGFIVESLLYGRPPCFKTQTARLTDKFETGMQVILFLICAYILVRRWRKQQIMMLATAVVMFMLATADVGISWNILLRHTTSLYTGDTTTALHLIYPKFLCYIINNLIADVLLVLRCYIVWDHKKIILIPSSIVLVIGTVLGFLGEGSMSVPLKKYVGVYIFMVVIFNLFITLLTAGRIYKIAREVRSIMGREMSSRYQFATAMAVESGLIYSIANILVLSLAQTRLIVMAAAFPIRIVGIMPLLIIVQITLGQSTILENARMTAAAQQTGTQTSVVFNTILSSDRCDAEGQRNIHRPSVESAKNELQGPSADECVNKEIEQRERKTDEVVLGLESLSNGTTCARLHTRFIRWKRMGRK